MDYVQTLLTIIGLVFDFVGATIITIDLLFLSKEQAIDVGTSRWASNNDEENLKLPQVRELLKQSRRAKVGFALMAVGFLLQLVGAWPC